MQSASATPASENPPQPCPRCLPLEIYQKDEASADWSRRSLPSSQLLSLTAATSPVTLIYAKALSIRECDRCKQAFEDVLKFPCFWWDLWCKRSNGYFGCNTTTDTKGMPDGYNTYARFLVKEHLRAPLPTTGKDYVWYKFNLFTRWIPSTSQMTVVIFEADLIDKSRFHSAFLQAPSPQKIGDPFWAYLIVLEEVIRLQDAAVWATRDLVRQLEKNRDSPVAPNPNYPQLHDFARHAIHVSETIDVSVRTMAHIMHQHGQLAREHPPADAAAAGFQRQINQRLHFFEHMLQSLRSRAYSNKERLLNEIQLSFNTVAQYDSRISVEVARVTQYDGFAMKTIAFLGLTFLPATFVSALFSMSFFNFDPQTGWAISEQFWIYWAVAGPVTVVTLSLWLYWPKVFPPSVISQVQLRPRGDAVAMRQETFEIAIKSLRKRPDQLEATIETV